MRKGAEGDGLHVPTESWWRRRLVGPVASQLTKGTSPSKLAWSVSVGMVIGIFPVMGTTTLLCFAVGYVSGLNQPTLHVSRAVVYPLHLILILPFIRLGERLYGVPLLRLSIAEMVVRFKDQPWQFAKDFGLAAWHGVSAWLLVAPVVALLIKLVATPLLARLAAKVRAKTEVAA